MKTIVLLFILTIGQIWSLFCQNALDYFMPDQKYKSVTYFSTDSVFEKSFYDFKNDTLINKMDVYVKEDTFISNHEKNFYVVSNNQINLFKYKFEGIGAGVLEDTLYKDKRTVFVLPPKGKQVKWSYIDKYGIEYSCTSEFKRINLDPKFKINDSDYNAVLVIRYSKKTNYLYDYYVKGIGLCEIYYKDGKKIKKYLMLDKLNL